jgi:putative membrane fusion protein
MPKPKKRTIYIFVIALVALYVVIEIIPFLTGALTRTEILKYGELKVEEQAVCYLVRSETVYSAPYSGGIKYKFEEGSLIKKGAKVVTFTKDDTSGEGGDSDPLKNSDFKDYIATLGDNLAVDNKFTAAVRGIFSTYVDGYEAVFTPANIDKLTYEKVSGMSIKGQDVSRNHAIKGEPIYKISDNSVWYLVFWIDNNDAGKYKVDSTITVGLPDGDVKATINKIVADEQKFMVVLKTNRYYKSFASQRKVQANMTLVDQRGLLVTNSSLTTKDDVVGVYVKNTIDEFVFKPVRTIATDGKQTLVLEDVYYDEEGQPVETVNVYDEVLKNPEADQ